MRRRNLLWWLAGALIAGIGAECGAGGPGPHVDEPARGADPDTPMDPVEGPDDWMVGDNAMWGTNITVWVEKSSGPTRIKVTATDHDDGNKTLTTSEYTLEYGRFVCPVAYPARHTISFKIEAHCRKSSPRGFITVREGGNYKLRSSCTLSFVMRKDVELVCDTKRQRFD